MIAVNGTIEARADDGEEKVSKLKWENAFKTPGVIVCMESAAHRTFRFRMSATMDLFGKEISLPCQDCTCSIDRTVNYSRPFPYFFILINRVLKVVNDAQGLLPCSDVVLFYLSCIATTTPIMTRLVPVSGTKHMNMT